MQINGDLIVSGTNHRLADYNFDQNTFIVAGINEIIYNVNTNEYEHYKLPLVKKMQNGDVNAFSIDDNEIVIGKNVSLVKITQNFCSRITNSFGVTTKKNGTIIETTRDYNSAISDTGNIQRTTTISTIVDVKENDRLSMSFFSTLGQIPNKQVECEQTLLIVEKIA